MAANTAVNFSDFHDSADVNISERMRMPHKITVEEPDGDDSPYSSNSRGVTSGMSANRGGMSNPMTVPERIVINGELGGYSAIKSDIPRELTDDLMPTAFMGGMSTPPRTLTVDDTSSAHYPQANSTAGTQGKGGERKTNHAVHGKQLNTNREGNHIDDESILTGLEIVDEVHPMGNDTDEEFIHEYEVTDLRQNVILLHRRVAILEREVDNNLFGFWSKVLFFTLTVVNPFLLQWLFGRRR